jgi:hypothetical protein
MRAGSSHLEYGKELIYFPKASEGTPMKVWFLSHWMGSPTVPFRKAAAYVTDEAELIRQYRDFSELIALASQDSTRFHALPIIRVSNVAFLHPYSKRGLSKLKKVTEFMSNRQGIFSWSRRKFLLPGMAETQLGRSRFFYRFRKWPRLGRTRFLVNTAFTFLFGIFKIPISIVLFFTDLFRVAFDQYGEFRNASARLNRSIGQQQMLEAFRDEEDAAALAQNTRDARTAYQEARERYTKLNLSVLTFLLSMMALAVTGYYAVVRIDKLSENAKALETELSNAKEEMLHMRIENTLLQTELSTLRAIVAGKGPSMERTIAPPTLK